MKLNFPVLRRRLGLWLRSEVFWRLILGAFLCEALWLVVSAQYPLAFDENYHYGLIQLHAHQWLPFFTSQPDGAGAYGAIVRDPSYLYHWLMSFPYRLIGLFTNNQTAHVIMLRLINVALFAYGLTLYRRVVRRLGASELLSNGIFAVFILIPVVPFLAAHINYDNLFFVAVPVTILLTLRIVDDIQARQVNARLLLLLLIVLCLSSLIKYPYLPILAIIGSYLIWQLWQHKLLGRRGLSNFAASFQRLNPLRRLLLVAACLVAVGMFGERYGMNMVRYHNPVPACNAVVSEDACLQYGPYNRDYHYKQNKPASFHPNIFVYIWQWLYGMWYRLFFAINYDYATRPPLFVISMVSVALAAWLLVGISMRFKAIFSGQPVRQLVLWLTLGYTLVLFADGFSSYVKTGQPVAINGRYLIPFLPFLAVFGGLAWAELLHGHRQLKTGLAAAVIVLFVLQGGGALTFIVRSNDSWLWQNQTIRSANRVVRSAVSPLIIGKNIY